jgi:hypothetical protein
MVYVIEVCWQLASRSRIDLAPSWSCPQAVGKTVWHSRIPLLCVYSEKTPDDGQRNCPKHVEFHSKNKFEKLVHLVGFILRYLSRCTVTWTSYHDARSRERHITMHGHVNVISRYTVTWTSYHDARSRERHTTMHGHMNVISRCTVTWTSYHDARSHERHITMHGHVNVKWRRIMLCKGKANPLQAWSGPEVSKSFKLSDIKTIGTWRW